mgnify:CR=1 FL=1
MKKNEIIVGGLYRAKVSGKLTTVRVDDIREDEGFGTRKASTRYDLTNLVTGRKTTFRSAAKFRQVDADFIARNELARESWKDGKSAVDNALEAAGLPAAVQGET